MSPHEFSISVHDLDAAGRDFQFPVRSTWLRGALEGTGVGPAPCDGRLELRLSKSGPDVVVRGRLEAELSVPCARCLEPARVPIQEDLSALLVEASAAFEDDRGEGDEPIADDGNTWPYDGETVVLDDLLGIPMIPLCSESCPGISPRVEGESNGVGLDPRLRPLLELKKT
jgi:uncharacterized protein